MKLRTRLVGAVFAALILTLALAGAASPAEIGSGGGGGGGGTTVCNPVSSLTAKGDATTSDTGFATVQVSYGVKSCDNNAVTAAVEMHEYLDPTQVVWNDPNAPLNGKFTVGVRSRVTYIVTVSVFDAATGVPVGSKSVAVAAVPKRI